MKSAYWYGYLEAGPKSSLVARDPNLDTGNPQTIYLFNYNRDEIKEYRLDIVQPKLRELTAEENKEVKNIEKKFKTALGSFKGRTSIAASIPEKGGKSTPDNYNNKDESYSEERFDNDTDIIDDDDDSDWGGDDDK